MFHNKNFNAFVKEIFFINTFNCNTTKRHEKVQKQPKSML